MNGNGRVLLLVFMCLGTTFRPVLAIGEEDSPSSPSAAKRLDKEINQLLERNPEIRLAEIKVQEAEVKLAQIRAEVTQRFLELRYVYEHQKAEASLLEAKRRILLAKGNSPEDPGDDSALEQLDRALFDSRQKRDKAEMQISLMLGQPNKGDLVTRVYPLFKAKSEEVNQLLAAADPVAFRAAKIEYFAPNNSMVVTAPMMIHESLAKTLAVLRRVKLIQDDSDEGAG